jgi:hypothetical protein
LWHPLLFPREELNWTQNEYKEDHPSLPFSSDSLFYPIEEPPIAVVVDSD